MSYLMCPQVNYLEGMGKKKSICFDNSLNMTWANMLQVTSNSNLSLYIIPRLKCNIINHFYDWAPVATMV